MAISINESRFRQLIREEYLKILIKEEEQQELSRESADALNDVAYKIAKHLKDIMNQSAMKHNIPDDALWKAVIDQVKAQKR